MTDLNITIEEQNLEKILQDLKDPEHESNPPLEVIDEKDEDMDTHGNVLLKYKCDICNKRVMTSKGLKTHISRMHEKSLQRIERERNQKYACDKCDIKRSTEVLLKSHMKLVHGHLKRSLSETGKGPKATISPPSRSPPSKKVKEEDALLEEEDLEKRIVKLKRPIQKGQEPILPQNKQKEIENLNRLLIASGEVIATLEGENNNLNSKAEFYEEVAESLVIENESLFLKIQQIEEQKIKQKNKHVSFNIEPEQDAYIVEEGEDHVEEEEIEEEKEDDIEHKSEEETGFRQQSGRVTCIVCGVTRNTKVR